jgi:steroid delta-isomerase-like uncharacterized protein
MAEGVELIGRFYEEILCGGDFDVLDELTADDFVDHEEGVPGQPPGKEGVKFFVTTMRTAFPDLQAEIGPTLESGDLASAHVTLKGTHKGDFMGVPASDKSFEIDTVDIIRVEGGRCAEHWGATDVISLMQQIGAVPAAA